MKRSLQKVMFLCVAIFLTGCSLVYPSGAFHGSSSDLPSETKPVSLDWYINFSWFTTQWGADAVSRAITEQTGVTINFITPSGSETEKLSSMLASDTLPDFITLGWWEPQVEGIMQSGRVHALNELADRYAPSFWEAADEARVEWYRAEDGNVYCYPNSSFTPQDYDRGIDIGSNQTFLVRKDLYEAIGSPDMTTQEGFAGAIRKAAEMFPTVDGFPLIPFGAHEFNSYGCDSFGQYLMNFLAVPWEKDGRFYDRFTDPEYISWLKLFRQLGEEKLLSQDIFLDKRAQMEEKVAQGRYFSMLYQRTDLAEQQKERYSADPASSYIAIDGPRNAAGDTHMLPGAGIQGWTVTFISRNCAHPDKAIELMAFLMSEEGQKLTYLGVEGEEYLHTEEGLTFLPEPSVLINEDPRTYIDRYGGNNTYWMLQDLVMQARFVRREEPATLQMLEWTYPYTFYTAQYNIAFESDSPAGIADRRIKEAWGEVLPKLLLAPTEEEFDSLFEGFLKLRGSYGYSLIMEESTRQMNDAKQRLGLD